MRLQEARRLLAGETTDVADADYRVGYESPSQFSREYSRLFGLPPSRDVQRLRASGSAAIYRPGRSAGGACCAIFAPGQIGS
ncbi:helix-turn-helix domain-containing protein [Variovorax sp. WS11]|uniref:helix-turn-helix domain-containing protein n=1 Tax=Variovorax sp. WS11 TaxID=1105204 RepID=UPI0035C1E57E